MVLIQACEDTLHDGLAIECGLGRYLELAAILVYGSKLLLVEIYDLTVGAFERLPLTVEKVRGYCWSILCLAFQG